jgi:hypothetical protein
MDGTKHAAGGPRRDNDGRPQSPPRSCQSEKLNKWETVNAIEYDAGTQSLSKVPRGDIKGNRASTPSMAFADRDREHTHRDKDTKWKWQASSFRSR